jgi:hypothetical protein
MMNHKINKNKKKINNNNNNNNNKIILNSTGRKYYLIKKIIKISKSDKELDNFFKVIEWFLPKID